MTTIEIKSIQQIDEAAQRVLNAIHGKNIV